MAPTVDYDALDAPVESVVESLLPVYETYEWWADRDRETWRRALAETDELVVVRDDDASDAGTDVVAAARVLTDYVYYAMVYDVVVHADRRGEGLGRTVVEAVVDHPRLGDVSPSLLAREGLVEFYERCGFADPNPIDHPDGDPEPLHWLVAEASEENETERA